MSVTKHLLVLSSLVFCLSACRDREPRNETELESYAIGIKLAKSYKDGGLKLDSQMVALAIDDVNQNKKIRISEEELKKWHYYTDQKVSSGYLKNAEENLQNSNNAIQDYLKESGAISDPSGIIFKKISQSKGKKVTLNNRVVVHYTGRLMNGKIFDSSVVRGQPAEFGLNNIIPGLREALLRMRVGEKMEVVIPPHLGYGASGNSSIPANSALKFDLEVLGVKSL